MRQDQFLEIYSQWRKKPTPETEEQLERMAAEIQELNPDFSFTLPGRKRKGATVVTGTGETAESQEPAPRRGDSGVIEAPDTKPRSKGSSTHLADPENNEEE